VTDQELSSAVQRHPIVQNSSPRVHARKNRHKPTCKRTVTQGTLSFAAHAGTDKVSFQGRISASKELKLDRYTLVITATTAVGQRSSPKQLSFTIV
jgi:hypothetical protein